MSGRPNYEYGLRPVEAHEALAVFGTAASALRATGGDSKLALFYIWNPDRAREAGEVSKCGVVDSLRSELEEIAEAERAGIAAEAWNADGTIAAVMRACKCGNPMAWDLLRLAEADLKLTKPLPNRKPTKETAP